MIEKNQDNHDNHANHGSDNKKMRARIKKILTHPRSLFYPQDPADKERDA